MKNGTTNLTVEITTKERIEKILKDANDPGSVARFVQVSLDQICTEIEAKEPSEKQPAIIPGYRLALNKPALSLKAALGREFVGTLEDLIDSKLDERAKEKMATGVVPFTHPKEPFPSEKVAETSEEVFLKSEIKKREAAKKTPLKDQAS